MNILDLGLVRQKFCARIIFSNWWIFLELGKTSGVYFSSIRSKNLSLRQLQTTTLSYPSMLPLIMQILWTIFGGQMKKNSSVSHITFYNSLVSDRQQRTLSSGLEPGGAFSPTSESSPSTGSCNLLLSVSAQWFGGGGPPEA
jgi:hypothetical protein